MTWTRLDDGAAKHPKARIAGNEAWSLWDAAIQYCNRYLTDGVVPLAALAVDCLPVPIPLAKAKKLAERCVDARVRSDGHGLFEKRSEDVYVVHDFLDWNPSKAEVEAKRKADRDRKRGRSDSGGGSGGAPPRIPSGIPTGKRTDSEPPRASARALPAQPSPAIPSPAQPEGPPVADADRETICPTDIVQRLDSAGVFTELSGRLKLSPAALRAEAERGAGYWLAGKGMGKKRRNWPGVFRQRLLERADQGEIPEVDEPDEAPPPDVKAKIAAMRGAIGG